MRYNTYTNGVDKVIVTSTYAGKTVRGIAKCSSEDNFDLEIGKQLAKARCDEKVAYKRMRSAQRRLEHTRQVVSDILAYLHKIEEYESDAHMAWVYARDERQNLEETL